MEQTRPFQKASCRTEILLILLFCYSSFLILLILFLHSLSPSPPRTLPQFLVPSKQRERVTIYSADLQTVYETPFVSSLPCRRRHHRRSFPFTLSSPSYTLWPRYLCAGPANKHMNARAFPHARITPSASSSFARTYTFRTCRKTLTHEGAIYLHTFTQREHPLLGHCLVLLTVGRTIHLGILSRVHRVQKTSRHFAEYTYLPTYLPTFFFSSPYNVYLYRLYTHTRSLYTWEGDTASYRRCNFSLDPFFYWCLVSIIRGLLTSRVPRLQRRPKLCGIVFIGRELCAPISHEEILTL